MLIFVLVKKPGDLPSQRGDIKQLGHGPGVIKKLPLQFGRERIPLHDQRGSEAAQHALFFFRQGA